MTMDHATPLTPLSWKFKVDETGVRILLTELCRRVRLCCVTYPLLLIRFELKFLRLVYSSLSHNSLQYAEQK